MRGSRFTIAILLLAAATASPAFAQKADVLSETFRKAARDNISKITGGGTSLSEMLGEQRLAQWHALAGTGSDATLESDLTSNLEMLPVMRLSPAALNVYKAAFATPYRTDVDFLRYFSCEAGKMKQAWEEVAPKMKTSTGSDLQFEDLGDGFTVINTQGGRHLGVIMRDEEGFSVFSSRKGGLLNNLYPIASAHYGANGLEWVTDEYGRPVSAGFTLTAKAASDKEDKAVLAAVTYIKATRDVDACRTADATKGVSGMHIIPPSLGGSTCFLNVVPVKSSASGLMEIVQLDNWAEESLRKGLKVTRTVRIEYPDGKTLRPSRMTFTYLCDGKEHKSVTIDN